jgi:hypothetical protein
MCRLQTLRRRFVGALLDFEAELAWGPKVAVGEAVQETKTRDTVKRARRRGQANGQNRLIHAQMGDG